MSGDENSGLLPLSDRVALVEVRQGDEDVILMGGNVKATVIAVGKGIPYGRGEFYAPVLEKGMEVFVPRKDWDQADSIQWKGEKVRFLHERNCLAGILK